MMEVGAKSNCIQEKTYSYLTEDNDEAKKAKTYVMKKRIFIRCITT